VQALCERSEGNPLFVLELLRLVAKVWFARSLPAGYRSTTNARQCHRQLSRH
jgi:hypothetical protein